MIKSVADIVILAAVTTGVSAPAPEVPEKHYEPVTIQAQVEQEAVTTEPQTAPESNETTQPQTAPANNETPTEASGDTEGAVEGEGQTPAEEAPTEQPAAEEEAPKKSPPKPGLVLSAKAEPSLFQAPPKPKPKEPEKPKEIKYDFDIASYTTKYSGAESLNRNYNMRLASDSINGLIMQPGDTFSYNDIILAKSHNGKDYKEAGIYSNGKVSTGIGGGICQISSTLYQAALYSGMEITQRRNHSLKVGYMPAGRDATASWGSIDFKFKNPLNVPVKIESVMKNGVIKIRFLAPKDPGVGDIKVTVEQKDGTYYLSRTRANGVVDYTARSKYLN